MRPPHSAFPNAAAADGVPSFAADRGTHPLRVDHTARLLARLAFGPGAFGDGLPDRFGNHQGLRHGHPGAFDSGRRPGRIRVRRRIPAGACTAVEAVVERRRHFRSPPPCLRSCPLPVRAENLPVAAAEVRDGAWAAVAGRRTAPGMAVAFVHVEDSSLASCL